MNEPVPDPAVVALAREVEALRRRVDLLAHDVERAQQTGNTAHRVLGRLADRVTALADLTAEANRSSGSNGTGSPVESWLAGTRPEALDELVAWMNQILIHYAGTADALGRCWHLHPWIVEELLALRAAWTEAYRGERASGTRAVDWHDRHRPNVMARIATGTAGCSLEAHQPGGRLHVPSPRVPSVDESLVAGAQANAGQPVHNGNRQEPSGLNGGRPA